MKTEKMNLKSGKQVLTRDELRKIMAGDHPACGGPCVPSTISPFVGCNDSCTCQNIGNDTFVCHL